MVLRDVERCSARDCTAFRSDQRSRLSLNGTCVDLFFVDVDDGAEK